MNAISLIDQQIDGIYAQMRRSENPKPNPESWQAAWDRHPELRARELELFQQRGVAQRARDERAAKMTARLPRYKAPKKCPTCGARALAAA
jgi:hypothetical protein